MQEYNLYFVVIILLYKYGYYNPLICAKIRNKPQTTTKRRMASTSDFDLLDPAREEYRAYATYSSSCVAREADVFIHN